MTSKESKQEFKIKVEALPEDEFDYVYDFKVHYNGEIIYSQVRLPMSIDTLFEEYIDNDYDIKQFKGSLKIFVKHKNRKIIKHVQYITYEYFYNGNQSRVIQAQEISDFFDDYSYDGGEEWGYKEEWEIEPQKKGVILESDSDDELSNDSDDELSNDLKKIFSSAQ